MQHTIANNHKPALSYPVIPGSSSKGERKPKFYIKGNTLTKKGNGHMVTHCFLMIFWFLNNSVGVDVWGLGGFLS